MSVNKRKPVYSREPESSTSGRSKKDTKRLKTGQEGASLFLIDGIPPVQMEEAIKLRKAKSGGRGRQAIHKNLASELIDESYPPSFCHVCKQSPENGRSGADLHFKTEHPGEKAFRCVHSACKNAYSSRPGLKYHLEHAHSVTLASSPQSTRTVTLSKAKADLVKKNKKLELSENLLKQLDQAYDPTICPACKEKFKKKTHVVTHLVQNHHGEEPYKCVVPSCEHTKTYSTRDGLIYHLAKFHD